MLSREVDGRPLYSHAVRAEDGALYRGALTLFGNWSSALCAAGLDPQRICRRHTWTSDEVIRRLRERYAAGQSLSSKVLQAVESGLYVAARIYFGGIEKARSAAGIKGGGVKSYVAPWTRTSLPRHLRRLYAQGNKINHELARKTGLANAAYRLFGSWDAALMAAGFNADSIRLKHRPWTKSAVMETIRRRFEAGESLRIADIKPNTVCRAARRFYGSWERAIRKAGVAPKCLPARGVR